jgi:hypothetical protein
MLITRKAAACAGQGAGLMSPIELEDFLAAMEVVRRVHAAAMASWQDLSDPIDDHDHPLDLAATPTVH